MNRSDKNKHEKGKAPSSLVDRYDNKKDWRLHITVLVACIVAELIGKQTIRFSETITIVLSPLIWSMLIVTAIYMIPRINILSAKNGENANLMMGVTLALLIAKLGVTSGASIEEIRKAGLALILQNFGNLGTILLALPVALLLKTKRESIGMCHAMSREANVGLVQDVYGAGSPEFRGVMAVYIVGTLFGPIIMSLSASIFTGLGIVSPQAASMGVGGGSAAMMTAGLSALISNYPDQETVMTAFAGLSNLISSVIAIPLGQFLGLPITEALYKKFSRDGKRRAKK